MEEEALIRRREQKKHLIQNWLFLDVFCEHWWMSYVCALRVVLHQQGSAVVR